MMRPSLCMIFEAIGPYSAIARVAHAQVRLALNAGYKVSVVAKQLDPELRPDVEWLKLYVPPRGFLLQWTTARHFIKRAIAGRTFDIIHTHQPQVANLADIFQCHFLTRVAYERDCLEKRRTFRARLVRIQQQGVLFAEDRYFRNWNPATELIFCSELVRREFARLYLPPPIQDVIPETCPKPNIFTPEQRLDARRRFCADQDVRGRPVVGFIGGVQERKGYARVIHAMESAPDIFLLLGGQFTDNLTLPSFSGRYKSLGLVSDTRSFYAACDILLVPSLFDPCPLVVFEAAAVGTPIIATDGVGNSAEVLHYNAGLKWDELSPLGPMVRQIMRDLSQYQDGARRLATDMSDGRIERQTVEAWSRVLARKSIPAPAVTYASTNLAASVS